MNIENLKRVLTDIQENRMISYDVVEAAIKEGLVKTYKKIINFPEAIVRADIDDKGNIRLFQSRTVIEGEVEDPDLEYSLEEARALKEDAQIGDVLDEEIDIDSFGRSSVTQVKNIMLQKIKEASKQMVYDEYIDKVDDLVYGTVQTVEEKFALIDLGKTLALMPRSEQIPGEKYYDGQRLRVVIKNVTKDSKGAQVVVSRSSEMLVKRLFESSVTEIYDGTVEIKAIAREANERTKMAVYSNNVNVDPIGACIGPRGARVLSVIDKITQQGNPASHENIDIFEWNPNYVEFVKNVLKPASVLAVLPEKDDEDKLLIVVEDNQLSLAIGKKGINARLAVRLLNRKIDIKTQSEVEAEGIDWYNEMLAFQAKEEAIRKQKALEELRAKEEERARLQAEKDAAEAAARAARKAEEEAAAAVEEPVAEEVRAEETPVAEVREEPAVTVEPAVEEVKEEIKEEPVVEETKEVTKRRKPKLEKASEYVSKYEELADAKKSTKQSTASKRKRVSKEDEEELELKKKLEDLKKQQYEIKPEYSDEELEEFNNEEDDHWYDEDVDYDDYDDYYD